MNVDQDLSSISSAGVGERPIALWGVSCEKEIGGRPAESAQHERAYWAHLLAEAEHEGVSLAVLRRLRLANDGRVLSISKPGREMLERFLRSVASQRLGREPVLPCAYVRALGHPVILAEMAFEKRDEPVTAAAMYALSHDDLYDTRHDLRGVEWLTLRFALARALVAVQAGQPAFPEAVAFVEQTNALLDESVCGDAEGAKALAAAMDSWLTHNR